MKFTVTIERITTSHITREVEAEDLRDALVEGELVLDWIPHADNVFWNDVHSTVTVVGVREGGEE